MPRRTPRSPSQESSEGAPPYSSESRAGANGPTQAEIAIRAYELFLARGCGHGGHEDDWYRAEQELRRVRQAQP